MHIIPLGGTIGIKPDQFGIVEKFCYYLFDFLRPNPDIIEFVRLTVGTEVIPVIDIPAEVT